MNNKTLSLLVGSVFLAATPSLVKAEEAISPSSPCNFSGAYVGLMAGYGVTKDTFQQVGKTGGNPSESAKQNAGMDGFVGGLFAGWGKEFASRFYGGFELSFAMNSQKAKDLLNAWGHPKVNLEKKDALDVAVRLGYAMNNTLPYLKLGWSNAKFKTDTKSLDGANKINETKRLNGFLVGVGMDVKLSAKMLMGLEYTYVGYGKWKGKHFARERANPLNADNYLAHERKPISHNVMLRLAYTF